MDWILLEGPLCAAGGDLPLGDLHCGLRLVPYLPLCPAGAEPAQQQEEESQQEGEEGEEGEAAEGGTEGEEGGEEGGEAAAPAPPLQREPSESSIPRPVFPLKHHITITLAELPKEVGRPRVLGLLPSQPASCCWPASLWAMSFAARRRATCAQVHTLVLQVSNPSGGGLKKVGGRAWRSTLCRQQPSNTVLLRVHLQRSCALSRSPDPSLAADTCRCAARTCAPRT